MSLQRDLFSKQNHSKMNNNSNNDSTSSLSSCPKMFESTLEKDLKKGAYLIVAVVGVFSNLLVMVAAVKYTVRKNLHHLIINMAVSDTLFIIFQVYEISYWLFNLKIIYPDGLAGAILCKVNAFVIPVSYRVSLVTLLVISIERYRATRLTLRRVRPYTIKERIAVIFVCWFPPMCLYASRFKAKFSWYCQTIFEPESTPIDVVATFLTVIILGMTSILSLLTVQRLYRNQKNAANLVEQYSLRRSRQIKATVGMVVLSTILYSCCWFPYLIDSFLRNLSVLHFKYIKEGKYLMTFDEACLDYKNLMFVKDIFLPVLNSCLSPYTYIIFLSDFRLAVKKLFCCGKRGNFNIPGNRSVTTSQMISLRQTSRARTLSTTTFSNDIVAKN